ALQRTYHSRLTTHSPGVSEMATATASRPKVNLSECHGKIRHPLQRLRVYIRGYVAAECVALLLLFVAAWFWLGLLVVFCLFALSRARISNLMSERTPPLHRME